MKLPAGAVQLRNFGYVSAIVSFLFGVSLGLYQAYSPNGNPQRFLLPVLVSLAISIFFSVVGFFVDIHSRLDTYGLQLAKTAEDLSEKISNLDDVVDARYLGLGPHSLTLILERLKHAQSVRNTLVLFDVPTRERTFASYNQDQIVQVKSSIRALLERGGDWTDLVSHDVVSSALDWLSFYRDLQEEISEATEKINRSSSLNISESELDQTKAQRSKLQAAVDHYMIQRLNASYPVVNLMLLQYGDGDKEVIFGQGHHSQDPSGRVFVSRNEKLLETFERYWSVLASDSTCFDPNHVKPVSIDDIDGIWFRVTIRCESQLLAVDGLPEGKYPVCDLGLVKISTSSNRKIAIEGRRFSTKYKRIKGFSSVAASLEDARLWFATANRHRGQLHGAGWYRFIRPANFAEKGRKIDRFYGEFVDLKSYHDVNLQEASKDAAEENASPHTAPSHYEGKSLVFGVRLREEWVPIDAPKGWKEEFLDDPKLQVELLRKAFAWWKEQASNTFRTAADEDSE